MDDTQEALPALDWEHLKERMRLTEQGLQAEFEPSAEQVRLRLEQRAASLAATTAAIAREPLLELLLFELCEEFYAVETRHVEVVVPLRQMTPIPCTPEFVLGVMSVRGRVRSILDLRRFFELPLTGLSDRNTVVVLSGGDMEFCLLADRIVGSQSMAAIRLQKPLSNLAGIRADYLLGVTHQHWAVLDAEKLLRDSRLIVNDIN